MFRMKLSMALCAVFLLIAGVLYNQQSMHASHQASQALEERLQVASRSVMEVYQLRKWAILDAAERIAGDPAIHAILQLRPEDFKEGRKLPSADDFQYEVHRKMNAELNAWAQALKEADHEKRALLKGFSADRLLERPEYFVVLDPSAVGVSDIADPARYGTGYAGAEQYEPQIGQKIRSLKSYSDLWRFKDAPLEVAVAPILMSGEDWAAQKTVAVREEPSAKAGKKRGKTQLEPQVTEQKPVDLLLGAVVLGYRLTSSEAERNKSIVGTEVAYFLNQQVNQSSSFDAAAEKELNAWIQAFDFEAQKAQQKAPGEAISVELLLGDQLYRGLMQLQGDEAKPSGILVLSSWTQAEAEANKGMLRIWVLCVIGCVLCLVLSFIFVRQFERPLEAIDQGVLEIVNGNIDYWFDAKGNGLPQSLSQNLNVLVCQLTGRPLPEEENHPAARHWSEKDLFGEPMEQIWNVSAIRSGVTEGVPEMVQALVVSDEETYRRDLFREYTSAMRAHRLPLQGITVARLMAACEAYAARMREQYSTVRVRFVVSVAAPNRVQLRAVKLA